MAHQTIVFVPMATGALGAKEHPDVHTRPSRVLRVAVGAHVILFPLQQRPVDGE